MMRGEGEMSDEKELGLADLVLVLAAPDGTYEVHLEINWDCPHEFDTAGEEEDEHMASPCDQAAFICMVTRGRNTAYEVVGEAEGPAISTELLRLAAFRAAEQLKAES